MTVNSAANDIEILTNTTCLLREEGMNLIQSHLLCPYMYLINGAALGVCRTWVTLDKEAVIVRIAECGILGLHHTNDGYAEVHPDSVHTDEAQETHVRSLPAL